MYANCKIVIQFNAQISCKSAVHAIWIDQNVTIRVTGNIESK